MFPVKKNKIIFSSFEHCIYFCNPKYIFLNLYEKLPELAYIWCLNKNYPELSNFINIVTIKNNTLPYIYHILTSKVIITNISLRSFLPYRKNQIIINTWHGGGAYKKVGPANNLIGKKSFWKRKCLMEFSPLANKNITYFISSCKAFTDAMHESYYIPYNKFLPIGMPRNDIFFSDNKELVISIRNKLNIPLNSGVLLYAPTHRSGADSALGIMSRTIEGLNLDKLKKVLEEKFNKIFIILFRGHPGYKNKLVWDGSINVSSYNDMQELLLITDVLITDYSSCIWDFSLNKKPCFLFTPDLDQYLQERGFYTPIEQWPYPIARTNEELCINILNFNKTEYDAKVKKHHDDLGSYEKGTATSKVTEILQEIFQ
jgi:CDP-glycerol glycerophosphotransferase